VESCFECGNDRIEFDEDMVRLCERVIRKFYKLTAFLS
jgi:hypothetical protein